MNYYKFKKQMAECGLKMGSITLSDKSKSEFENDKLVKGSKVWISDGASDWFIAADGEYASLDNLVKFEIQNGICSSVTYSEYVAPSTAPMKQAQAAHMPDTSFGANGKPRSNQLQRFRQEVLLNWGKDTLNTNEAISFPNDTVTVGTSVKNSRGQYLSDGNYSLKNGTNFQIENGLVSVVMVAKATVAVDEIKLEKEKFAKKANSCAEYMILKNEYGDAFNISPEDFLALSDHDLKMLRLNNEIAIINGQLKGKSPVKQEAVPVAKEQKKSLLQTAFDQRGWENNLSEEEGNRF
jgi:hypothetical protein